jgi:hypothetical protein
MPGRDTKRGRDPDDWFADLDPIASRRERSAATPQSASTPSVVDRDDPRAGWRDANFLALVSDRWVAIGAGVVLAVCLLVAGLVLGGAFSGSKHHAATTTLPSTRPTTTAATTTQPPAASVPAPTTTLKPGDQGSQVVTLQKALKSLGDSVGTIDGNYGAATQSAVARFQTGAHLTADGIVGPATLAALVSALRGP